MKEIADIMIVCTLHRFLQFLRAKVFSRAEISAFFINRYYGTIVTGAPRRRGEDPAVSGNPE